MAGPLETVLQRKINEALKPSRLEIHNDSAAHAHHAAMKGATSQETHFRLLIVSDAFQHKRQPERHRIVYRLLDEELKRQGGVHALQLRTLTHDEDQRHRFPES